MNDKYDIFIELLNFHKNKYTPEQVFKDFIVLFGISLSNKVFYNQRNNDMYEKIYNKYEKNEQYIFYTLSAELTKIFCNESEPYDILGEIYQKISNRNYLTLVENSTLQDKVNKKLQSIIKVNKKLQNGEIYDKNCGSGTKILAYASILKTFKLDYKIDLEVTAIDTDIINVFMTYIQLYFFEISAEVILQDRETNKELMRLWTQPYEDDTYNLMAA